MKNLSIEDQTKNRTFIERRIKYHTSVDGNKDVKIFNPYHYFNYQEENHKSEKEVMNYELRQVKQSNVIIVDFNDPNSLGTMSEMAIAYDNDIPIIGYNPYGHDLHAWQTEMCERIFTDINELIEYVVWYYVC